MKKGRFKPGESGNLKGRPVGAINKISAPIKDQIGNFVNEKFQELPGIWNKLNARDKASLLKDLLPFVVAKLQAIAVAGEINFQSFTDEQLDQIANRLLTNNKKNEK